MWASVLYIVCAVITQIDWGDSNSNCVVLKVSSCVKGKACVFIYVGIAAYVSHAIWF